MTILQTEEFVPLQDILITPVLTQRPARPADFAAETRALQLLAQEMRTEPQRLLQCLVTVAQEVCHAGSAGISYLEHGPEGDVFRWIALSGALHPYKGRTNPRQVSPCGTCLDRQSFELFADLGRYYAEFRNVDPPIVEALILPVYVEGRPLGTIWITAHHDQRQFDSEDLRLLKSLGDFTGMALQLQEARDTARTLNLQLTAQTAILQDANAALLSHIDQLQQAEVAVKEHLQLVEFSEEIGRALTEGTTLHDILQRCTEAMVRHLSAAFARIWILNPTAQVLELQASAGQYTHLDGLHSRVPVGQFKIGRIAQDRQSHLTNAVIGDPAIADQAWAAHEGMIAFAGYPLVIETHVVGVMALFARHPLTEATFQALATVAHGIAVGIQRKQAEALLVRHAAELQRSNEALQQFSHVVSHDLQEPLRTVTSFVQLLAKRQQGNLDAESKEFIDFAVQGAERMQALIRDLLAYTRVGSQTPAFTAVPCDAVLASTLQDLHGAITDTAAVITHEPLPTVQGDAQQLGLVFQNLLSNALKFRTQAPPHIHVTARQQAAEWVFAIQDDGIGLDPHQAKRIFGVFQRLHARQEYPGTGLGLAICKAIIEQHGGRIWVESERGKGATFFFTLPVYSESEAQ